MLNVDCAGKRVKVVQTGEEEPQKARSACMCLCLHVPVPAVPCSLAGPCLTCVAPVAAAWFDQAPETFVATKLRGCQHDCTHDCQ